MGNYWIFKVADDENAGYSKKGIQIYTHRMRECFWGINGTTKSGRKAANIDYLKKGDDVLFYLVGKDGHCFLGNAALSSGFRSLSSAESAQITHKEYLDWEQGVSLDKDTINVWPKPLPIEHLRGKVHFVPNSENFGSYLQGSVTRIKQWEYEAILREHELFR